MRRLIILMGLAALAAALVALAACEDSGESGCGSVPASAKGDASMGIPEVDGEIVTTGSCLRYIDTELGAGESPQAADVIAVHYSGYLEDGTKFDSSVDGQPFVFQLGVGRVIPGWDEGLATMQVGGKRRLIIPPELGRGVAGSPPTIPANATLIFDVELLEIQ
ncbi:MAG: FKBP-type peptidyl-prolyl cis-trans isomerase [Dehalococcoidia bacterium]